ncbi:MAG: ACT domain-containing protein [Phycisphaerales bacterium]|nr:ACT domain-containing protein [Phycisphaerales bacterium]
MSASPLTLAILPGRFAVCRLEPDAPITEFSSETRFFSVTRTDEELSVVCPENQIPANAKREMGWRCLKVQGPLHFSCTGVLASLSGPLADAAISIFSASTYDTDYLFVKEETLEKAAAVLSQHGHVIQ